MYCFTLKTKQTKKTRNRYHLRKTLAVLVQRMPLQSPFDRQRKKQNGEKKNIKALNDRDQIRHV